MKGRRYVVEIGEGLGCPLGVGEAVDRQGCLGELGESATVLIERITQLGGRTRLGLERRCSLVATGRPRSDDGLVDRTQLFDEHSSTVEWDDRPTETTQVRPITTCEQPQARRSARREQ